jgi:hypothetical protein
VTIREDLLAIWSDNTLTRQYKRSIMRRMKMWAFLNRLNTFIGPTFVRGRYTIKFTQPVEYRVGARLALWIEVTKDGAPVPLNLPIYVVNPPVRVPDGQGGFEEDLIEVIQSVIIGLVK